MSEKTFLEQLDEADDESAVRKNLAMELYGTKHAAIAKEWISPRESARDAEVTACKEAREEESLSISRKALDNSRSATRIATIAIALSTIMAMQEIIEWYSSR